MNWVVVRTENKDDAVVNKLKKAYQSKEVKEFIEKNLMVQFYHLGRS